jgi:hypothetical protein
MTAHVPYQPDDRLGQHEPGDQFAPQPHWPATPRPGPSTDDSGRRGTGERVLDVVTKVIVIITCIVLLYTIYTVNSALSEFGDRMQEISSTFGG